MSGDINYKQKYQELKAKYMQSVDMAFRLGFEEGAKQAGQDAAMQQQQQVQDQQNAGSMPGGADGGQSPDPTQANGPSQPGDDVSAPMPGGATPKEPPQPAVPMAESEHPDGSELDQHIAKLESMLQKTEIGTEERNMLQKSVAGIRAFRQEQIKAIEMKKSYEAIAGIAKALHKTKFKIGVQAQHNLSSNAKQAVSMQEKIVSNIMEKWEQEESRAGKDILSVLGIQNLTKKE
jgi:hypothetical protein